MPRIATLQTTCVVGDVEANVSQALLMLEQAGKAGADLAVLPECFATGIGEHLAETAEPIPGPSADRLCEAADAHDMWIVAGMAEKTEAGIANTALVIAPGGKIRATYHKRFLYMQEADAFIRGDEGLVVDTGFVTAGIAICYDYIFPEYIRALVDQGARLIIHPTAWVTTDIGEQWHYDAVECYRAQCRVRALENGVYFISANHGGEAYDPGGFLRPVGNSCVIAPWGQVLGGMGLGPGIAVVEVDFDAIEGWAAAAAPYLHDYQTVPVPPISRI